MTFEIRDVNGLSPILDNERMKESEGWIEMCKELEVYKLALKTVCQGSCSKGIGHGWNWCPEDLNGFTIPECLGCRERYPLLLDRLKVRGGCWEKYFVMMARRANV